MYFTHYVMLDWQVDVPSPLFLFSQELYSPLLSTVSQCVQPIVLSMLVMKVDIMSGTQQHKSGLNAVWGSVSSCFPPVCFLQGRQDKSQHLCRGECRKSVY